MSPLECVNFPSNDRLTDEQKLDVGRCWRQNCGKAHQKRSRYRAARAGQGNQPMKSRSFAPKRAYHQQSHQGGCAGLSLSAIKHSLSRTVGNLSVAECILISYAESYNWPGPRRASKHHRWKIGPPKYNSYDHAAEGNDALVQD